MAGEITVSIEGKTYDLDDFELGELEWLEEYIEKPLMADQNLFSMRTMVGFVYLIKRRDNADFTIEEARKIKLNVLSPDDTPDEGDAPKPKRPTKARTAS